jgi:ribosomal protein S18 acetylase RimI-like enzyme
MTIRFFQKEDVGQVVRLFQDIVINLPYYNDLAKRHEIERYSEENLIEKINEDPKSIIVADCESKIVGVCFNRFDDFTIWLEWILVDSRYRQHNVGTQLIEHLEIASIERDCHKIWCDCRTSNDISKKFLQSVGFKLITTIENHWYQQDFVLMQKLLDV